MYYVDNADEILNNPYPRPKKFKHIEDARAYAIRQAEKATLIAWSIESDDNGTISRYGEVHLSMSYDWMWIREGSTKKDRRFLYHNGKIRRS